MEANLIKKPAFAVIGKQGSTEDGPGFIGALWEDANAHFDQVEPLAGAIYDHTNPETGESFQYLPIRRL